MNDSTSLVLGLTTFVLLVVIYVWLALALSSLFGKAGEDAWKGWVPVLNMATVLKLGGFSPWLVLLGFLPLASIAYAVLLIISAYRISRGFGYGAGMTVLAAFFFVIWASVLGFGSARWIGAAPAAGPMRTAAPPPLPRVSIAAPPAPASWAPQAAASPPPPPPRVPPPPSPAPHAPVEPVAPIASVPGVRSTAPPPPPPAAVTEVPAAFPAAAATDPWAPPPTSATRPPATPDNGFPELSEAVSAVVGAPDAGSPRSARSSVSALYANPEIPADGAETESDDDDEREAIDQTVIARRRRIRWALIPPGGAPVDISSDVVILGRRPAADPAYPGAQLVSIPDETRTVSKTHARLELRAETWYVTDLGSTNGVLFATLMGTEVEAQPGQEIEAGERFFLGDAEVRLTRSEA